MRYEITGADGRSMQVDAVDWMMAMCQAIERLGIEVSGWVCDTQPHGVVHVADPLSGQTWVVRPVTAPQAQPRPAARPPAAAPPPIPMHKGATPRPVPRQDEGPPADLAERLFDLSVDLSQASDPNDACRRALDLTLQLVPCAAGSVLRGGINDDVLTFVAVAGPAARELLGRKLRFGEGLVGAAFDLGITIQVNDVSSDPRHQVQIDKLTGFHTRSVLCVPVRTPTDFYGAIELLNPPRDFLDWHVEVVEQVGKSLASTLSGVG